MNNIVEQGELLAIAVRRASRAPMVEVSRAEIRADTGVANDFRGKPGWRQVTVLDAAAWQAACDIVGHDIPWTVRRANLLVSGLRLENSIGAHLRIGDVVLKITGETDPCQRMEEQVAGLLTALTPDWRGGVCCQVVSGGGVEPGIAVVLEPPAVDAT